MNRRSFLRLLGGATAAVAALPVIGQLAPAAVKSRLSYSEGATVKRSIASVINVIDPNDTPLLSLYGKAPVGSRYFHLEGTASTPYVKVGEEWVKLT